METIWQQSWNKMKKLTKAAIVLFPLKIAPKSSFSSSKLQKWPKLRKQKPRLIKSMSKYTFMITKYLYDLFVASS
jgi:hypothetical protein